MRALSAVRSALAFLLVLLWMILGGLYQRLLLWPVVKLFPERRKRSVSRFMRGMSRVIFSLLRLGGARFERRGRLVTGEPCLVLMNHQSLLDIITVVVLTDGIVPVFVTRRRYAYGVPVVSQCLRLLGCPIIDPRRDARGAAETMAAAAAVEQHGLVVFPEGHRSRDGSVGPFKAAGTLSALRVRRVPVYLVVADGFWRARRLADFAFNVGAIHGRTDVLGPFTPPADETQVEGFILGLREVMVARLDEMRRRADEHA